MVVNYTENACTSCSSWRHDVAFANVTWKSSLFYFLCSNVVLWVKPLAYACLRQYSELQAILRCGKLHPKLLRFWDFICFFVFCFFACDTVWLDEWIFVFPYLCVFQCPSSCQGCQRCSNTASTSELIWECINLKAPLHFGVRLHLSCRIRQATMP